MVKYPQVRVKLSGTDGNAFSIMGRVSKEMKREGLEDEAKAYLESARSAQSYDDLLRLTMDTVEVT